MTSTSGVVKCPDCGHAASKHRGSKWKCQTIVSRTPGSPVGPGDWCDCTHTRLAVADLTGTSPSVYRGPAQSVRRAVIARDGLTCLDCGTEVIEGDSTTPHRRLLTIDHIVPRSAGGKSTLDNLRVVCFPCNSKKGARL